VAEGAPKPTAMVVTNIEPARVLCDRCFGRRLIGAAGHDPQVGAAAAQRTWPAVAEAMCPVCEGGFMDRAQWLAVALEAAKPYHFQTFQVGTRFPGEGEGLEKSISKAMGQEKAGENIRTEANRWLAAEIAKATGARTDPAGTPELVIDVDTRYWTASAEANAVYVWGRYNKLRRDIPQTHWPCRRCEGKGCWQCDDTGVTYAESVEQAIGDVAHEAFAATGYSFHGAGREDIDALMLGTGRPFVVESTNPKLRTADLAAIEASINSNTATTGVAVRDLRMSNRDEVAAIKEGAYEKEYLAHCVSEQPTTRAAVEEICSKLQGVTLEQRTPDRVSHRRADLVRKRKLHTVVLEAMPDATHFDLRILAESGTYIKETVNSDEGRTTPSVAGLLGFPCKVEALDVVAIFDAKPGTPKDDS
jgi:tRNA pseudouridine synthase 10